MSRQFTRGCVLGLMVCMASAAPSRAQVGVKPQPTTMLAASASGDLAESPPHRAGVRDGDPGPARWGGTGELHGVINDDRGRPLAGAVVSALGPTTAFAVTDGGGRFAFRHLPPGPYLVRAHLQGYTPARGRIMQVAPGGRVASTLTLVRRADSESHEVLAAGVGPTDPVEPGSDAAGDASAPRTDAEHEHGEIAWRMRHLRRSVLKEAEREIARLDDEVWFDQPSSAVSRALTSPARLAAALFGDMPLSGQINLLTTTSFDRPQELFSADAAMPRGVAYLALEAPGRDGDWIVRGTITQGDLSSWILAGSYTRHADAEHRYEAGLSYSTQRYLGGNSQALAAMREGSRNVGSMYAYDDWAVGPRMRVGYGAKYARYDYLADRGLFSPRVSVAVQPVARDALRLRASISHREEAPGAEEFLPPAVGLWLPPERTFSQVSRGAFRPERLDHVEVAAEREWPGAVLVGVRVFSQRVGDQGVTIFGLPLADGVASIGHYQVGSAGDVDAHGWGVTVSRAVTNRVRAAVDYTLFESNWRRRSPDAEALGALGLLRQDERLHDVTASIESIVAPTSTRVSVIYKVNTGFADDDSASPLQTARFNVQVNQALPFQFASAHWEMLVAVSNLFQEDAFDGSVYDELLVLRPPKRVLGGVTVRF